MVDIYRDAKRRGIYSPLFTDPEGDSCFSIELIRWIKNRFFNFSYCKNIPRTYMHLLGQNVSSEIVYKFLLQRLRVRVAFMVSHSLRLYFTSNKYGESKLSCVHFTDLAADCRLGRNANKASTTVKRA